MLVELAVANAGKLQIKSEWMLSWFWSFFLNQDPILPRIEMMLDSSKPNGNHWCRTRGTGLAGGHFTRDSPSFFPTFITITTADWNNDNLRKSLKWWFTEISLKQDFALIKQFISINLHLLTSNVFIKTSISVFVKRKIERNDRVKIKYPTSLIYFIPVIYLGYANCSDCHLARKHLQPTNPRIRGKQTMPHQDLKLKMGQTYSPPSEHHNALLRVKISDNGVIVHCVLDNFLVCNLFEIDDIFGLFRTYIMGMHGWVAKGQKIK